ncbi:cell wall-binding repeat-containing protein [[Clostridium] dakarense]|uniref:cell wall-binding repeat-containing protein n=1 Tax=Faecalimicrobium dakarense TaxID=1301100 RepID=UPI0004B414A3|nr:cell wall-binding repeat-containing protein [[Clostridium] dakarense]
MLKRKKKVIAKVMATTMLASTLAVTFAPGASALEPRATVSSSKIAGDNRYETAVKVSEAGWTSANNAVLINGEAGLVDALTATPYANLKNAPILVTHKDKLTPVTKTRLTKMGVKNVDIVGGTAVVSENVVKELKDMNITVNRISGSNRYTTAVAVAEAMDKISDVSRVSVVNGATGLPDAVSIAAPAAYNKMPILLSNPNTGLKDSKAFIDREDISRSYVVGETAAVSDTIMNSLPGTKVRLGGARRQETNAKVIKEFYPSKSLSNIYVSKSGQVSRADELVDALAVGVLATKEDVPVMIVGNNLDASQQSLLASKEFTRITQVGHGIPEASINAIKATQADTESKVNSVSMVNYKTIKLYGSDLDKLSASNIYMSGNSVRSYTTNSSGTEATVEFNNAFNNGTNTVRVTSNLGNSTNHSFTYSAEISSVQATTKEVGTSGVQYVEFTVNGNQKRTVDELKALGWTVEFKSTKKVFYNQSEPTEPKTTSNTGKLVTSLTAGDMSTDSVFDYEVILKKGSTELKSGKAAVTVVNRAVQYKEIKSYEVKLDDVKITSNRLVVDEEIAIDTIKGTDLDNNEVTIGNYTLASSNPSVAVVTNNGKKLKAISTGSSEITIKSGNVSKKFTITVSADRRKMNSVRLDNSSVRLVENKAGNVVATVTDQYGDPIKGKTLTLRSTTINSGSTPIATALANTPTDKEGKTTISISAQALPEKMSTASGTLYVKSETNESSNLASVTIYVSKDAVEKSWKLNLADAKKDTSLDMYKAENDNEVVLKLNNYNSGGYLLGEEDTIGTTSSDDANTFWVKTLNKDIATVETSGANITVKAGTKTGNTTIEAYKGKTRVASISIYVKDTTPKITSIAMNDLGTITKDNVKEGRATVKIEDLINSTIIGSKTVVEGVSMTGTKGEVLFGSNTDGSKILFVDSKDGAKANGSYDDGELILATLELISDIGTVSDNKDIVTVVQKESAKVTGSIIVKVYHGEHELNENPFMTKVISVDIAAKN